MFIFSRWNEFAALTHFKNNDCTTVSTNPYAAVKNDNDDCVCVCVRRSTLPCFVLLHSYGSKRLDEIARSSFYFSYGDLLS